MCKFLPCPKECEDAEGKIKQISRRRLEKHLERECPNRDYVCESCGEKGTHVSITQVHDGVCKKKLVPCPNSKCKEVIAREVVSRHVDHECGYTVVSCKYQDIGCDAKLKRHDMAEHEEGGAGDRPHLHMALEAVMTLRKKVAMLEEKQSTLKEGETMLLKVTDFENKKLRNDIFVCPPFYTSANGYHMTIQVHANGCGYGRDTHVSIYTRVLQGKNDQVLDWPFNGTLSIKLLNQLENDNHHVKKVKPSIQSFDVDTGTIRGCAKFIPHSALAHDLVKNTQYLKDDTLYFRVSVEVVGRRCWLE